MSSAQEPESSPESVRLVGPRFHVSEGAISLRALLARLTEVYLTWEDGLEEKRVF